MHPHGPVGSLADWLIVGDRSRAQARRRSHLVALAESRVGRPTWLDRARARARRAGVPESSPAPAPMPDCCAVA